MEDKAKKYYEYLKGKNVDLPPTFESFQSTLQDDDKRQKYYEYLSTKDVDLPPTFDSFSNTLVVKKKQQTQPQEEVSTEGSQTPVQPSGESGKGIEPITTISGGEITEIVEPYKVNDSSVTRDDLINALKDEQFVESIRTGQTKLSIQDDPELEGYANSIIQPPSEKKIDESLSKKSEGDDSVLDILGRSFQSGITKLAADIYRTPEFIYDIAVDGYNQLLELQNKILPESLEARKIATSEELSEMTGIDNKYAENLEAYAEKKREINEKYQKPIFDNIKKGNYSDAALSTAMSVTESLPFMLSMMIPSAAGVKAASMFGGTTAVMGAGRKQELLEGDKELSETQMNTNALLYGMAEATDVLFGTGAVGRAIGDVVRKEGVKKGKDFASDVVKNLVKERAYLAPFTEGLQESFTTYTQNVSDRITGVDTEKPLTEGVIDSFIVGATMGGGSATVLQGAKYLSGKMKGKQNINDLNNVTKNSQVFNEVTGQIDALVNTGELTEEEANTLKEDITNDVQTNASIPDNIQGEDRVKAIELQKKYTETKINQEQASEAFKDLYKAELDDLKTQLQELALKKPVQQREAFTETEQQEKVNEEDQTKKQDKDAIQEQTTDEGVLRQEQPEAELQEVVEGDQKQEVVTEEEKTKIAENIGKSRKVKPKNIKGLIDVMGGIFGLKPKQAESAAVIGDVMVENMAKRAGVSKDEMYQKIAYAKSDKAPDVSLKQEAPLKFKSTAKEGLGNIKQKAATPEQWVKMINDKGGKGTNQELEWIGLQDYLNEWKKENNAKSVPKEVVEQYINDNQIDIVEVSKSFSEKGKATLENTRVEEVGGSGSGNYLVTFFNGDQMRFPYAADKSEYDILIQAVTDYNNEHPTQNPNRPKYSEYQLDGGKNYREVLLTLPNKRSIQEHVVKNVNGQWVVENQKTKVQLKFGSEDLAKSQAERLNKEPQIDFDKQYKSSHWDESNILAHLRLNERTLPNGERVLFIEEVQSDWAQEGKKKGFDDGVENLVGVEPKKGRALNNVEGWYWEGVSQSPTIYKDNDLDFNQYSVEYYDNESTFDNKKFKEFNSFEEALDFAQKQPLPKKEKSVPQMPYKKTDQWVGMAMRRAMQMAAQEGFDRIAWVTGEQSADRYDLSKQVDYIDKKVGLSGDTYVDISTQTGLINLRLNEDNEITEQYGTQTGDSFVGKSLDDVIGKELAQKVLDGESGQRFEGEDLKVGGEGMKAFYNSILPKVAKKEAQRFDKKANVEVVEIEQKQKDERYERLIEKRDEFQKKANESSGYVREAYLEDVERTQKTIDKEYKTSKQLSIPITDKMRMNLNNAVPLFQNEQGAMTAADGKYVIYALTDPNVSTPLHELAHVYEHYLTDTERKQIEKWSGHKSGTVEFSEAFARGFEKFLSEGKVSNPRLQKIFENFKQWLTEIYNGIKGSEIDIKLNAPMRKIYDNMLTEESKAQEEVKQDSEAKKKRGFAKSAQRAFTDLKDRIEKNPENYYTPQEWSKMKETISDMTNDELIERMSEVGLNRVKDGDDNNAVLASIELINRRLSDGKPIDDIVERFSKEGTRMGQLIAQFATLNNSTPFGIMSTLSKIMEKNDKILSKDQKKKIQDLAKGMLEKNNKLKQFLKNKGGNATTEDINNMKRLRNEAEAASREFFNYTSSFTPMSWADILSMTVKGNLLTIRSQAANVIYNLSQQGIMIPVDIGKNLIDVVRGLFGKKRVGSVDPRKYVTGFLGAAIGLKESWNVITKGGTNYAKGEVKRSFKPFTAASQALSGTFIGDVLGVEQGLIPKTLSKKGKELLTKAKLEESKGNLEEADNLKQQALDDAKVSLDDRLKKFYESFFGVAPEIMFRLLSLGDKPFYYFTQYKNLYVEGKRKGLRGERLRNFVMMPDAKTLESVEKESLESVFMEDGVASRTAIHITASVDRALKGIGKDSYFSKLIGSTLSFIFKTQVPYVKTPTNIISQTIDFAIPPVAVAKAISAYTKGDNKSGDKNIAIAATGFIIGNVATMLISEGLVSSPFDFGEDKEDEKNVKYDVFPPNHLNISGVKRLIEGKDPSIKPGDTTIDLRKLGMVGALILIRSSQNKRLYKEEKNNAVNIQNEVSSLDRVSAWAGAPMDVTKYSMEQSFLAGTSSLLEALKGGQGSTQRWLTQTSGAISSVALPNTMADITRATDSYLYDTRQEEVSKMIESLMYDRLGFTGLPQAIGVEYPIRVDMWGNDMDRTPEGRNALFYHLFDVSKAQNVPTNKLSLEVYNLYRNTLNPNTVPNLPKRTFFYEGNKYYIPKTTEGNTLLNEYAKVIGQARKRQAEKEIEKNSYKNASIEERANKMAAALARGTNSKDVLRAKKNLVKQLMQNKNK